MKSCGPILELGRSHGVDLPITEHVAAIVHQGMGVDEMRARLLGRPRKTE